MEEAAPILKMSGISKTFPGVKALSKVSFQLKKGEIHALMGENGAGKSTLIKVLTGVERQDEGSVILDGSPVFVKSPQHAQELGISTVYQEVNLCTNLSVAENIFIGREPIKHGKINWKEINKRAVQVLSKLDLNIDVTKILGTYSVAMQQMVAIARALDISAKVLILDEPTSSLDSHEVKKLFEIMKKLKREGMGIIFITHFLDQVYEVSDRITVLRNGELVGGFEASALSRVQLVSKMIGKAFDELLDFKDKKKLIANEEKTDCIIKANKLGRHGTINPFDLEVRKREVLGLTGLLGSGRSEVAKVIFGADKADSGEMYINGKKENISAPIDAILQGIAFCPEDRKADGIVGDLTVRENIILALQAKKGLTKKLTAKEQQKIADDYIKLLNIKTAGTEQLVKNLSGGNQQKVILARWLVTQPQLLILDEPTRGIDVGTKAEIQKLVLKLASEGMSVIFISSELDETLRCCSRIAILRDKKIIAELSGDEVNENIVMQTIAGEA
jgi:simple sugar transport system ATP-binding protein